LLTFFLFEKFFQHYSFSSKTWTPHSTRICERSYKVDWIFVAFFNILHKQQKNTGKFDELEHLSVEAAALRQRFEQAAQSGELTEEKRLQLEDEFATLRGIYLFMYAPLLNRNRMTGRGVGIPTTRKSKSNEKRIPGFRQKLPKKQNCKKKKIIGNNSFDLSTIIGRKKFFY
jgi:hypothetical protein